MGMPLTKYQMMNVLSNQSIRRAEYKGYRRILKPFRLFGIIIHDSKVHQKFHQTFSKKFDFFDSLTGQRFLFLGMTDAPQSWINEKKERENREYFKIWELDQLTDPNNTYQTNDESITSYSIAKRLKIEYEDLPVIILTNNLEGNDFRAVKTCHQHLQDQLLEITYFCNQKEEPFSLTHDEDFNSLIEKINLCGGSTGISLEDSIASTFADLLSFLAVKQDEYDGPLWGKINLERVIHKIQEKIKRQNDPIRIDQLNLSLVGCLSNLFGESNNSYSLDLSQECENESVILARTYSRVYQVYQDVMNGPTALEMRRVYTRDRNETTKKIDYTPLLICLTKIFEIEINLSLVHYVRESLRIEMPDYFNKYKHDPMGNYNFTPARDVVNDPRPINFNAKTRVFNETRWLPPGIGRSELVLKTFYLRDRSLPNFHDPESLFNTWKVIRAVRNSMTHNEVINKDQFNITFDAFKNFLDAGHIRNLTSLKSLYKPPN